MVSPRIKFIACFAIVAIIGIPTLALGIYGQWNYPVFYDLKPAFAICLCAVAVLSIALLSLCRASRHTAIFALLFTGVWVLVLLPETQYYLQTRGATENSIVEPFYRQHEVLGYILVLLPAFFVSSGFWLRRRQTI
jgi:hypothetical protein